MFNMNEKNGFGFAFKNAGRAIELFNHFLDKEVEITLRNDKKITGILNYFSEEFVIVSGKHLLNLRYVMSVSVIG